MLIAAAKTLVKLPTPQDEMFVVSFNESAHIDQDWTNDESKLAAALDKTEARGGSSLRDAVGFSIDNAKSGKNETKVLLLITDGEDNTSAISMADLLQKAEQSGIVIYSIGLLNDRQPSEARTAKRALHELAKDSGGQDVYPTSVSELDPAAVQMMRNIRSQYLLGYSATDATRDIKVSVSRPDLRVFVGQVYDLPSSKPKN
jgi:Ca-activated chloride channel family protein